MVLLVYAVRENTEELFGKRVFGDIVAAVQGGLRSPADMQG